MARSRCSSGIPDDSHVLPNWIAGEPERPPEGGSWEAFEAPGPASADGAGSLSWTCSRSRAVHWETALEGLDARAWGRLAMRERAALLTPVAEGLLRRAAPGTEADRELGGSLGLDLDESCPGLLASAPELDAALWPFGAGLSCGEPGGTTLLLAHWSEGVGGLAGRVLRALVEGRVVVLLSDPRLPLAADLIARAFEFGPPGVLAVLHDDGLTLCRLARETPGLHWWGRDGDPRLAVGQAGSSQATLTRQQARPRTLFVGREANVPRAAREAVVQACGRSATLSGQLPDRVGRVLCHELRFSEFTDQLLAALDQAQSARAPLPLADEAIERTLLEACAQGLDEGACLISGGEPWRRDATPPATRHLPGRRFGLSIFTNVDPTRSLVRHSLPCPVLALMRVPSDAAGVGLARELDQERGASPATPSATNPALVP